MNPAADAKLPILVKIGFHFPCERSGIAEVTIEEKKFEITTPIQDTMNLSNP
jgi:hypothetical protein